MKTLVPWVCGMTGDTIVNSPKRQLYMRIQSIIKHVLQVNGSGKDCSVNDVVTACSIYTLISCNKLK